MKRARVLRIAALVALLGTAGAGLFLSVAALQEDPFPHERHTGLFPLCTGCHEGIPEADTERFYPEPEACVGCHDGTVRERVSWSGPTSSIDNVAFDHAEHGRELDAAGDPAQGCASCHNVPGGSRMAVADSIQLATCWSCHAHTATDHQTDADCVACHVSLAETDFDVGRIEALPVPRDHEATSFLLTDHGTTADQDVGRCATCHTRDRCVACHVDADQAAIGRMPAAPGGMELPPASARYEEPRTHQDEGWLAEHGAQASRDSCATCHTSNDCTTCHVAPFPGVVATLPASDEALAPGVALQRRRPDSHQGFFMQAHATLSVGDKSACETCHQESFCVDCHDGPPDGGYHPPSFVSRHSAEAFGRSFDCATCHSTEVFCRECHQQLGLVNTGGRLSAGYHDGGPLWLLRHGQAARQGLESCASCHKQVDCTQCHGVLGAFKVSPHSSDFDAARAWSRSPRTCLGCHIGNPLNGGEP